MHQPEDDDYQTLEEAVYLRVLQGGGRHAIEELLERVKILSVKLKDKSGENRILRGQLNYYRRLDEEQKKKRINTRIKTSKDLIRLHRRYQKYIRGLQTEKKELLEENEGLGRRLRQVLFVRVRQTLPKSRWWKSMSEKKRRAIHAKEEVVAEGEQMEEDGDVGEVQEGENKNEIKMHYGEEEAGGEGDEGYEMIELDESVIETHDERKYIMPNGEESPDDGYEEYERLLWARERENERKEEEDGRKLKFLKERALGKKDKKEDKHSGMNSVAGTSKRRFSDSCNGPSSSKRGRYGSILKVNIESSDKVAAVGKNESEAPKPIAEASDKESSDDESVFRRPITKVVIKSLVQKKVAKKMKEGKK